MTLVVRWWRFNAGGFYGFMLQILALTVLSRFLPLSWATAIAVETAILHNFVWHELFTWKERHVATTRGLFTRAIRFQVTNGLISIVGNVAITTYLHQRWNVAALIANGAAIAACSLLNFAASEWVVFRREPKAYPEDGRAMFV